MFALKPKKSLGQNFLIDKNIVRKIVNLINLNKKSTVIEVGAGTGILTSEIIKQKPKKIYAIEKDSSLVSLLNRKFESEENIKILKDDILLLDESSIVNENAIVFGNLPYNLSTQLLAKWILLKKWPPWYKSLTLMFQKEVADRIIARNNTKNYGRLAILSNWRLKIKKHFEISKNCFFPKPKVDSTLLSFFPVKQNYYQLKNPLTLENITRSFFSNRRKMINKTFFKLFEKNLKINKKIKLDLNSRPAEIKCDTYYKLAQYYEGLFD